MMINKYAIVKDGTVINTIVWDGESDWQPSEGEAILCPEDVSIGWKYEKGRFIDPNAPTPPTDDEIYDIELNALNSDYDAKKSELASAFLNAALFDGDKEQQKKTDLQGRLKSLNDQYSADMAALDKKYGG